MRAWVFRDSRQHERLGSRCPWSVGWYCPETGKRKSKRVGSKTAARQLTRELEGSIAAGSYVSDTKTTWEAFRDEHKGKIMVGMSPENRRCTLEAINHFERLISPRRISAVKTQTIDLYISRRKTERGLKRGSTVSPATINKELRHLRAVIRIATDWGYLSKPPKFRMMREPKKLVRYVTPEHFALIYEACDHASFASPDWWRAFLTFAYMTGWRVSEILSLRKDDVDLEARIATTWDNKGKRAESVPLHPVVVNHLQQIIRFTPEIFPWDRSKEALWLVFGGIQRSAGINLPCGEKHEHSPACHVYGFHDLRRAFATNNAERMTPDALQSLMRHKSYVTTQKYINLAMQTKRAVDGLHVPAVLQKGAS